MWLACAQRQWLFWHLWLYQGRKVWQWRPRHHHAYQRAASLPMAVASSLAIFVARRCSRLRCITRPLSVSNRGAVNAAAFYLHRYILKRRSGKYKLRVSRMTSFCAKVAVVSGVQRGGVALARRRATTRRIWHNNNTAISLCASKCVGIINEAIGTGIRNAGNILPLYS